MVENADWAALRSPELNAFDSAAKSVAMGFEPLDEVEVDAFDEFEPDVELEFGIKLWRVLKAVWADFRSPDESAVERAANAFWTCDCLELADVLVALSA